MATEIKETPNKAPAEPTQVEHDIINPTSDYTLAILTDPTAKRDAIEFLPGEQQFIIHTRDDEGKRIDMSTSDLVELIDDLTNSDRDALRQCITENNTSDRPGGPILWPNENVDRIIENEATLRNIVDNNDLWTTSRQISVEEAHFLEDLSQNVRNLVDTKECVDDKGNGR